MTQTDFLDQPPESAVLTTYDREHMKLYLRLLDAATDGADWREAVEILFGLDPDRDPQRAQHVHDTHLARARWMTTHGYRELVREGYRH
ncbi:DNA -binding domain-containing protein [Ferrovibrio xuzhouensis]|uniref:DNA -binding domain-containing protein n=1 Tax=Ferrovibrio xuzhouensis TaxID=1576914 RepID=A0ABV7VJC3_9PROT